MGGFIHGGCMNGKIDSEYLAWNQMIQRCTNSKVRNYHRYGGRGITVCPEWRMSYKAFIDHIGKKPLPSLTLDRINNNGNYESGNVRWTTIEIQARNSRTAHMITFEGKTQCVTDWVNELGLDKKTIRLRHKEGIDLRKRRPTSRQYILKTHCIHGHELSGYNLVSNRFNQRACRICMVRRTQEWRSRNNK